MPPATHKPTGLTPASFAPPCSAAEAAALEWQDFPPTPDGTLDTTGMTGLRLRCADCGQVATAPEPDGTCMCEDCGGEHFLVQRLVQRREVPLPQGASVRLTRGTQRFVHIDLPEEAEGLTARYTLDGSPPNHNSPEYRRPFRLPKGTGQIRVRFYGPDTVSPELCYTPEHKAVCALCGAKGTAHGASFTCPECGGKSLLEPSGAWVPDPAANPLFSCTDCGSTFPMPTGAEEAKCPHCGAAYHRERGRWKPGPKDSQAFCPICRSMVRLGSHGGTCPLCGAVFSYSGGRWVCQGVPRTCALCRNRIYLSSATDTCRHCGARYSYARVSGWRVQGAQVTCVRCGKPFSASQTGVRCPHCGAPHLYSKGTWGLATAPRRTPSPRPPKEKEENELGCSYLVFVCLAIWLLLKTCS